MDGIFCNNCGTELDEAPTLPPDQRLPCPSCGSVARRFDASARIEMRVSVQAHAGVAEGRGEALPPTVQTINAHSIPSAEQFGVPTIREARHVTDQLVVMGRLLEWSPLTGHMGGMSRSLWWVQLSEQPTWLVLVVDQTGKLIDLGIELENDQLDALAGVVKSLLPSGAGPMRLTIRDQAGEEIDGGLGYDSIKGLADLAESLLPRHPG